MSKTLRKHAGSQYRLHHIYDRGSHDNPRSFEVATLAPSVETRHRMPSGGEAHSRTSLCTVLAIVSCGSSSANPWLPGVATAEMAAFAPRVAPCRAQRLPLQCVFLIKSPPYSVKTARGTSGRRETNNQEMLVNWRLRSKRPRRVEIDSVAAPGNEAASFALHRGNNPGAQLKGRRAARSSRG